MSVGGRWLKIAAVVVLPVMALAVAAAFTYLRFPGNPDSLDITGYTGRLGEWEVTAAVMQARRLGIEDTIAQWSADGLTRNQIATRLRQNQRAGGLKIFETRELVDAVRTFLGIPPQEDRTAFRAWQQQYRSGQQRDTMIQTGLEQPPLTSEQEDLAQQILDANEPASTPAAPHTPASNVPRTSAPQDLTPFERDVAGRQGAQQPITVEPAPVTPVPPPIAPTPDAPATPMSPFQQQQLRMLEQQPPWQRLRPMARTTIDVAAVRARFPGLHREIGGRPAVMFDGPAQI